MRPHYIYENRVGNNIIVAARRDDLVSGCYVPGGGGLYGRTTRSATGGDDLRHQNE